jgi:hypothetical protein
LPQRLAVHLTTPVDIVEYTIQTTGFPNQDPKDWTFEYSDDGSSWTVLQTVLGYTFVDNVGYFFTIYEAYPLTTDSILDGAGLGQIHAITASYVTSTPEAVATVIHQIQTIDAPNPLFSTPSIPHVNLPITQTVTANALIVESNVSQTSISQWHVVTPASLTVIPDVSQGAAVTGFIAIPVELTLAPVLDVSTIGQQHIIDAYEIVLTPWFDVLDKKYLGVTYSTENRSITTYSNFNFDGGCVFNGKTLLFNDAGIFEHGGDTDNGSAISPSIKTGFMDVVSGQTGLISTHKMKRIPKSKVLVMANKNSGNINLNVTADTNTYSYLNNVQQTGFATFNIDIGRGIKYNKLQLELVANGCTSLDIESVSFNPIEIVRSQR